MKVVIMIERTKRSTRIPYTKLFRSKILRSGWSAYLISFKIGKILGQPEEDILRIIINLKWDIKLILTALGEFPQYRENL